MQQEQVHVGRRAPPHPKLLTPYCTHDRTSKFQIPSLIHSPSPPCRPDTTGSNSNATGSLIYVVTETPPDLFASLSIHTHAAGRHFSIAANICLLSTVYCLLGTYISIVGATD
jgi:hypothetical protein